MAVKEKVKEVVASLSGSSRRKRMNMILEICKYRKDKNALACFDDDCQKVEEQKLVSTKSRRRGDGTIGKTEIDTGNILISCVVHKWRQLCSVSQLDDMPMPARTTKVLESGEVPKDLE